MATIKLTKSRKTQQQGVVLIVSLVFLIALTAVVAALLQNTTADVKMAGASEDKMLATQAAVSAIDEVIFNQITPGNDNVFAKKITDDNFPNDNQADLLPGTKSGATASVDVTNNLYKLEADCPHSRSASSVQIFACNVLQVQVNRNYGRENNAAIVANSGIAQQLLK